jgi:cytochrome P450
MQPFTFSNGITVSPGETLASPAGAVHLDDSVYEKAKEFDGFRFSTTKEMDGDRAKAYSVNTGTEFLTFGHGEHAWYQPN